MKRAMPILAVTLLFFLVACSEKEQAVVDSVEVKNIIAKQPGFWRHHPQPLLSNKVAWMNH